MVVYIFRVFSTLLTPQYLQNRSECLLNVCILGWGWGGWGGWWGGLVVTLCPRHSCQAVPQIPFISIVMHEVWDVKLNVHISSFFYVAFHMVFLKLLVKRSQDTH